MKKKMGQKPLEDYKSWAQTNVYWNPEIRNQEILD